MRFYKKRSYAEDFRLFRDGRMAAWYALLGLLLLAAPALLPKFYVAIAIFVGIYAVAGAGLMLLSGYCGQISLGHAAFLAVGAYTTAILETAGVPFPLALVAAGAVAGLVGLVVGLPALRLQGIYLAIATLAAAFIVEEVIVRWEALTKGASGMQVPKPRIGDFVADNDAKLYYIVLVVALLSMLAVRNIVRSPLGLAMMAIRESETAAQSMGVNPMRVKLFAFAMSAVLTGFAGALYAHKIPFITPDQFNVLVSIELVVLIFVGGIGSMHGIVFGALFVVAVPQGLAVLKDYLPKAIAEQSGLQAAVFGAILLAFILFEPTGIAGMWRKTKHYFSMFPFYRKGSLKRAKSFAKSESW